jgi:hypothetical protein
LIIAVIQGKSNEVRWRDNGYDTSERAIERDVLYHEESKEADPY